MKHKQILFLAFIAVGLFVEGCSIVTQIQANTAPFKYSGYESADHYKDGQILPVDALHADLRTVTNARKFNAAIQSAQCDQDLQLALKLYTKHKK